MKDLKVFFGTFQENHNFKDFVQPIFAKDLKEAYRIMGFFHNKSFGNIETEVDGKELLEEHPELKLLPAIYPIAPELEEVKE